MSILHWGQSWWSCDPSCGYQYFAEQVQQYDTVRSRGMIPLVDWGSFDPRVSPKDRQPNFALRTIINGSHDEYIRQWATEAKDWGHPFFLRFDHEMNGWWQFPWSEKLNGNQPGDYVKMWRHVHDIFTQVGASNVTWVWCPNIMSTSPNYAPLNTLYPGDNYVDWTCLDGYNKDDNSWSPFNQVFSNVGANWMKNSYQEVLNVAPNKPMMIGEIASREAGDGGSKKAAWIKDALLTQLPTFFPKIKGVLWFNWYDGMDFRIESSQAAQDAFAASIASSYYATNTFQNLNVSPIPPP
jgi:hypothetical protein